MIAVVFMVTLLVFTSVAEIPPTFSSRTSINVRRSLEAHGSQSCPSKETASSLGCSCRRDSSSRISVRCDAARWNAETSSKFAEIFKNTKIWGFQFHGEPTWKDQGRDPKTLRLTDPVVFAPFTPLCGLDISNFELKNFAYNGYPPECQFPHWGFNNATINFPMFISAMGESTQLHFINQKNIGSLNGLRSLRVLSLLNCGFFDTKNIRGLSGLTALSIYGTLLQSTELSAEMLPRGAGDLRMAKFKGCNISSVNSDLLKRIASEIELDLSYNHIVELPRELFEAEPRFKIPSLNVAGNPLDCEKLEWLKELIETKAISLIDEELTYCANPRGIRFIKERKLNLNVDVEESSDDFQFFGAELGFLFGLSIALPICLIGFRLWRNPVTPSQTWFDESYPREDEPCVEHDKKDHLSNPSKERFIFRET